MKNTRGFTLIEGLLILVIVGLLGGTGWYVWHSKNNVDKSLTAVNTSSSTQSVNKNTSKHSSSPKTTPYSFTQLGISMDVLSGWEVKSATTTEEGSNFYTWTVTKTGADGKIAVNSTGFRGGFEECILTPASIKEVAATNNSKLVFMSWSYVYDNKTNYRIGIVTADEAVFKTTNNESATSIKNSATKTGDYYFCLGYPLPGFSLGLNSEAAPSFSRKDSITALSSSSSDTKYEPLSPTAQSYADIKTMLTSIK